MLFNEEEATMRIRASLATLAMVALVAAAGSATRGAAEDKTLTIGVLGPLSGGAASYGVELVRGAEMKADEINKAGGLKVGNDVYHIKIVSYDHKALAADAATAANKLVFQDKVKYIIGNAVGATCNAVQTVTEPEKVLFSFVCWGTANLGPDKPYSFRAMLSQWEVAEPFYRWVKEKHPQVKRVALISPNDTSGKDTNTAVVKALKNLGFEVAADEYYERGTKDFYPILTKLLATKPDMLDVAAAPAGEGGLILKQARELGFKGAKGWTAGTNPFTIIGVAGKEAAEGVWSPTNINVKSDFVSATVRRFGEEYEKRYKEVPGVIAVANYAAFDVITKAMQDARSLETDKVLTALTQKPFDTVWGKLVLGGKDTYGIDRQFLYPMVISEIRDGKVVDIAQVLPAALKK
jgi:branched-chain amino acid transport system substrate-binding protein